MRAKIKANRAGLHLLIATLLSTLIAFSLQPAARSQSPALKVIRAARMIDVKSGNVINNPVVVIEGGRIKQAGANVAVPAGAEVIDLGGMTLLPGLIDCHTHLLQNYDGALGGDDQNMILTVT